MVSTRVRHQVDLLEGLVMSDVTDPQIVPLGSIGGHLYPGILSTVHNMHAVILHLHGFPGEPFEETVQLHQLFTKIV